ncbi:MAG: outer membrane protein [Bacteroidetes bacterium]|nr:outer membrane protein [Bacteroidota bacterium]
MILFVGSILYHSNKNAFTIKFLYFRLKILRMQPNVFLKIKFILLFIAFSQNAKSQSDLALTPDEQYDAKNYIQALDGLLKLEKEYPGDIELKHRIGVCYLNIHTDKSLAIPYFKACYKTGNYKNELLLELAKAYHFAYKFKEAVSYYHLYREKASGKSIPLVDHYIETCENAIELVKKPINITLENLGKEVNTKYADYYPFVTKDEKTLFYTSRRDQNTGRSRSFNGYFTSDIYTSKVENGNWSRAKNMGVLINTNEDEQCVGISSDGKNMIMFVDNNSNPGDLFHTEIVKTKTFEKPVPFEEPINSGVLEAEGCYSADGNTIFFVSNRKGCLGETDIYTSKRLPNGKWGIPVNLGNNINTIYKEAFPQISDDGKTLYFSSQGHTSMGGFDIFRATWNEHEKKWNAPVNLGYPLNTTDDDMMFSVAGNKRDGYISAWRKEGLGDLDIYKIIFNNVEEPQTALMGYVSLSDTSKKEIDAFISIKNLKTNEELDSKNVNKITGKYLFIVPPGKYQIEITSNGNITIQENITILDKSDFKSELKKDFVLRSEHFSSPTKNAKP